MIQTNLPLQKLIEKSYIRCMFLIKSLAYNNVILSIVIISLFVVQKNKYKDKFHKTYRKYLKNNLHLCMCTSHVAAEILPFMLRGLSTTSKFKLCNLILVF